MIPKQKQKKILASHNRPTKCRVKLNCIALKIVVIIIKTKFHQKKEQNQNDTKTKTKRYKKIQKQKDILASHKRPIKCRVKLNCVALKIVIIIIETKFHKKKNKIKKILKQKQKD